MRDQHHTAVIARNDLLPPLYIVEGLLSPPPLYTVRPFRPNSLRYAWGFAQRLSHKRGRSLTTSGSLPGKFKLYEWQICAI